MDRDDSAPEALGAVLAELRQRFGDAADLRADLRAVRVYLAARGYDARRIEAVVTAFVGDREVGGGETPASAPASAASGPPVEAAPTLPRPAPFRMPAAHERARFSTEAWGHLIHRRAAAGWSVAELEHVIERALVQIDGRIAVDDLRALIDGVFGGPAESTTVH
ncbi:MAG: hypothetical protein ACXW65_10060 [Gemmatirosa sp.]